MNGRFKPGSIIRTKIPVETLGINRNTLLEVGPNKNVPYLIDIGAPLRLTHSITSPTGASILFPLKLDYSIMSPYGKAVAEAQKLNGRSYVILYLHDDDYELVCANRCPFGGSDG